MILVRIQPEKRCDRWYSVTVQRTLFDPVAVVCAWGSRRSCYQRLRVVPAASYAEAEGVVGRIVEEKKRRGYCASP
jgi:predicted DNA-binding WGR domain protein